MSSNPTNTPEPASSPTDECENFALMMRQAFTEYDFEEIEVRNGRAVVSLKREVLAEDGKSERIKYVFSDPTLVTVIESLKTRMPSI